MERGDEKSAQVFLVGRYSGTCKGPSHFFRSVLEFHWVLSWLLLGFGLGQVPPGRGNKVEIEYRMVMPLHWKLLLPNASQEVGASRGSGHSHLSTLCG